MTARRRSTKNPKRTFQLNGFEKAIALLVAWAIILKIASVLINATDDTTNIFGVALILAMVLFSYRVATRHLNKE